MVDDETQTLEEGRSDQIIPCKVLITKNAKLRIAQMIAHFLLKSYSIQTLSWCSHCDRSDIVEKTHLEVALGYEDKF